MKKFSWNTHYLVTRIAAQSYEMECLRRRTRVTRLEEFLALGGKDLEQVISSHLPFPDNDADENISLTTDCEFLMALKLNPRTAIPYVRAIEPEAMTTPSEHDLSRSGPPADCYEPTTDQEEMKISEILATFSDEPDWGMDQELFTLKNYNYGHAPFGIQTGPSSQAAFHMAFFHENPLLKIIIPDLRINFVRQRAELFLELARLAIRKENRYWGWRFCAWAVHYLQDLTQPYHARALPFSSLRILRGLARRLVSRGLPPPKNYLVNRHHIFESLAHYIINEAVKNQSAHVCLSGLECGGDYGSSSIDRVMMDSSKVAAGLAVEVNRKLEEMLKDTRIDDPEFSVLEKDYSIEEKVNEAKSDRPQVFRRLMDLMSLCLQQAGMVTRSIIRKTIDIDHS